MAIVLYDQATNRRLFEISEEQLASLQSVLEEEDEGEHNYYLNPDVCDFLEGHVDTTLLQQLRTLLPGETAALGDAAASQEGSTLDDEEADDDETDQDTDDDGEEEDGTEDLLGNGIEIVWRRE